MNFNIFRTVASSVQTRPGIRVPTPIEHRQTFHVPSPARIGSPVKSLPVRTPVIPYGTHEVTTIIRDQRANPGIWEFLSGFLQRVKK